MGKDIAVVAEEFRELLHTPYIFEVIDHSQIRRDARQFAACVIWFVLVCAFSGFAAGYFAAVMA